MADSPPMAVAAAGSSAAQQGGHKTFTLVSSDGKRFPLPEAEAALSTRIVPMSERGRGMMLLNISGEPLAKVVEYLNRHAAPTGSTDDDDSDEVPMSEWEEKFLNVGDGLLYDILVAADDLNIDGLVDLASRRVADMIKGKVPGEIRAMFGIDDDFTPEQRAEIRVDNPWI